MRKQLIWLALLPISAFAANPQIGFNELAANQAQPHITINAADRAITSALLGQLTINFASDASLTLANSQWQYATIVLTDTGPVLTTGRDVIYPNVDSYTAGTSRATFLFKNSTAQTLTVKRSGQTGVAVTAGSTSLLHHNGTDIEAVTASGGSGAPTNATYITQTANGSLSAEQALSALSTGIVKNTTTTGVLSIAASADVIGTFSGTCTSSSSRYLATDGSCQLLSAGGDASTNTASSVDSEITLFSGTGGKTLKRATGTGLAKITAGVLSTATAGTDYYAPGGTDVAFADGGTGLSTASDDQTLVSSGSAWVAKTLPDCTDSGGNHINYTQSTNAFSCGTSGGGGGTPGGSTTQVQYNNAGAFGGDADYTWTAASNILALGNAATNGIISTQAAGATADGLGLTIKAGTGGATSGTGGHLSLAGGTTTNGTGGNVVLTSAAGTGGNSGGTVSASAGNGNAGGNGGDISFTSGDPNGRILFANTVTGTVLTITAAGAFNYQGSLGTSGQPLLSAGSAAVPQWGTVGATAGGSGLTTIAQGSILYGSATDVFSALAKNTTATRYLANTGTSNNPAWAQVALATGVSGTLPQANRLKVVRTVTAAGAITGAATDEIICINKTSGAATTVNLHASPATGFVLSIKDCKGDALTNNITVTPNAGNVDGGASYVINTNYGAVTLFYNGTLWLVESDKL